jgi:hypothetical protein
MSCTEMMIDSRKTVTGETYKAPQISAFVICCVLMNYGFVSLSNKTRYRQLVTFVT